MFVIYQGSNRKFAIVAKLNFFLFLPNKNILFSINSPCLEGKERRIFNGKIDSV